MPCEAPPLEEADWLATPKENPDVAGVDEDAPKEKRGLAVPDVAAPNEKPELPDVVVAAVDVVPKEKPELGAVVEAVDVVFPNEKPEEEAVVAGAGEVVVPNEKPEDEVVDAAVETAPKERPDSPKAGVVVAFVALVLPKEKLPETKDMTEKEKIKRSIEYTSHLAHVFWKSI